MLFSETTKSAGGSGFHFDGDTSAPDDAVQVSSAEVGTAINLPEGKDYAFRNGKLVIFDKDGGAQ